MRDVNIWGKIVQGTEVPASAEVLRSEHAGYWRNLQWQREWNRENER